MRETIKTSSQSVRPPRITLPEKHYTVALFLATTVIGMLIIIYGVYSASRDLEMHYKINTLYSILESRYTDSYVASEALQSIPDFENNSYHIAILSEDAQKNNFDFVFPVKKEMLIDSRVNDHGGFITQDNELLIWVILQRQSDAVILVHHDNYVDVMTLFKVYAKYLTVPTFFYVWLMIWATLIIQLLNKKLHTQKEAMEHLALYDGLTDLPNRNLFNDRLENLISRYNRQPTKFSLAIIDLNDFKKINDSLGHCYGDALLAKIAKRLKESVRESDTVARIGGDEYAMLLSQADNEDMLEMCKRIHEKIVQPMILNDIEVRVGASIGIASFPEHGVDAETLLHKADQSMYKIKACGGGALLHEARDTFEAALPLHSV